MNITYRIDRDILYIALEGRIDASNAPEAEERIFAIRNDTIDYNEYVGRIAIGRIERGTIKVNQEVAICDYHNPETRSLMRER